MTGSAWTRWTLHRGNIIYIREGVRGREGQIFFVIGGWRMTGSAWTRWTLCIIESYVYKGGSLREGGPNIFRDWRLADFF